MFDQGQERKQSYEKNCCGCLWTGTPGHWIG